MSANSKYTCTSEESKLIFINNSTSESWSVMDLCDTIKGLKLCHRGDLLALITSAKLLLIIDLQSRNILHKFESPFCIEHFKWSTDTEGCFYMLRRENTLEKWMGNESEFTLSSINIPSLMYFDLVPGNDSQVVILNLEGELIAMNHREKSEFVIDRVSLMEAGPVFCLDSDLVCLQTPQSLRFYSMAARHSPFTIGKTIFRFDYPSQLLLFSDIVSFQVILVAKDDFLHTGLNGPKIEVNLLDNPLEIEMFSRDIEPMRIDLLVRHNNQLYSYPVILKEPSLMSIKSADSFRERDVNEMYAISKEAVQVIIENLNKKFEEHMKKLDKSLAMAGTLQNMNKSIQFSVDKKYEDLNQQLKGSVLSAIIQSFKAEVLNSLVTQLETDSKEALSKISYFFQDRLKLKLERNNREEERLKKLSTHMKACVVGFIGLEDHIAKTIRKKTKTLTDFDLKTYEVIGIESPEPQAVIKNNDLFNLKLEVDQLLTNKKYELGILRVLQENNYDWTCSTLQVINPRPLITGRVLAPTTIVKLFVFLIDNIGKHSNAPDINLWLEELAKEIPCSDITTILPKIFEVSFANPSLSFLAKICSKKLEEAYKYES